MVSVSVTVTTLLSHVKNIDIRLISFSRNAKPVIENLQFQYANELT